MPIDKNGVRADIVADPDSTVARMNVGRTHEHYLNGASRKVKSMVIEEVKRLSNIQNPLEGLNLLSDSTIKTIFAIPVEFLSYFDNPQYHMYKSLTDINLIKEILKEIISDEFIILYSIDYEKKAHTIIEEIRHTIFAPLKDNIYINGKLSKDKILIAPLYAILLCKIADSWLSTSSSRLNHFSLPSGLGSKKRLNSSYNDKPVRIMSETEGRIVASYLDPIVLKELKDRATSKDTHKAIYEHILRTDKPTDVDDLRKEIDLPYGNDRVLQLLRTILNCSGIDLQKERDEE